MNRVSIAVNICTYKREKYIKKITDKIEVSFLPERCEKPVFWIFTSLYYRQCV